MTLTRNRGRGSILLIRFDCRVCTVYLEGVGALLVTNL